MEDKIIKNINKQDKKFNEATPFKDFVRKFKRQKTAVIALIFVIFLFLLAVLGSTVAPYGLEEFDYSSVLQGPSLKHFFGTDEFGRDIFSRVIIGTRISFFVGIFSVSIGAVLGTILGLLSGYYGGIIDNIIMRICDTLFAFPGVILAIGIVAILGSGIKNVIIAVAVFSTPTFARLVRSSTINIKESVYIQAARNIGVSSIGILFKHILPSAIPNIIVQYTMSIGTSILTASSLSFLGLGATPPTPEWGLMLSNGRNYVSSYFHIMFFPGMAIFLTVLSFNLLGDGLRDVLDPKLKN